MVFITEKFVLLNSISNYPNYTDIVPPSRFSDAVSGDSTYDKKTASSPRVRANQKFQRETFQINV